jgi:hypothetical protein
MRATLVFLAIVLGSTTAAAQAGVEETVGALEERMQSLRRGTWDLDSRIGETHRRLAGIELSMRGEAGGARVSITQHNHVGAFYRLVEATYSIDGVNVFHERDEGGRLGAATLPIHDASLAPGSHVLSVVLRYHGEAGDVITYVRGYRLVVRSSHTFVVPEGQRLELGVDAYEHPERGYTERLDVVYTERHEDLR